MTRTPLRPLARILSAREKGENPDAIERENIRLRHEAMRDKARVRAEGRLLLLGIAFLAAFITVGARMGVLASTEPAEPQTAATGASIIAQRADITDRQGRILATNLVTHSLYAQPQLMVDPERAASELAAIFPDLNEERLKTDFTGKRKFLWVKKKISPEQMQLVHEIGDPGLLFGPREMRLYPNGAIAAHVLGGASFGREGVHSAEVVGVAGVEKTFDRWLRDPANGGAPLHLSLDLTIQSTVEDVLYGGMKLMNAKGATAVLMDVHSGEVVALASLPDFDPNTRPSHSCCKGDPSDSPLFNRAVQGVYELGSTFKIFTVAQAMELGLVNPSTMIETKGPMVWGRFKIRDFHNYGPQLAVTDVIVKSSNIGTAHIAKEIGGVRQQEFLNALGMFDPTGIELVEAPTGKPLRPKKWPEITTLTVSYGHGIAASPLHLAAAYASILNGGTRITPTILKRDKIDTGARLVSEGKHPPFCATCCGRSWCAARRVSARCRVTPSAARPGQRTSHWQTARAITRTRSSRPLPRSSRPTIRNMCWWSRSTNRLKPRAPNRAARQAGRRCRSGQRSSAARRRFSAFGRSLNPWQRPG